MTETAARPATGTAPHYGPRLTNEDLAPLRKQSWGSYNIFAFWMSDVHGVPVADGVQAAVLTVQALVEMGLRTGKRDEFAVPPPKRYTGLLRGFGH